MHLTDEQVAAVQAALEAGGLVVPRTTVRSWSIDEIEQALFWARAREFALTNPAQSAIGLDTVGPPTCIQTELAAHGQTYGINIQEDIPSFGRPVITSYAKEIFKPKFVECLDIYYATDDEPNPFTIYSIKIDGRECLTNPLTTLSLRSGDVFKDGFDFPIMRDGSAVDVEVASNNQCQSRFRMKLTGPVIRRWR